jgi:large subunit ribosomal protein L25
MRWSSRHRHVLRSDPVPEVRIDAVTRTEFGKGAARRLRRADQIPAVVYSHGDQPVHLALPARELSQALKTANVLLEVRWADGTQLALPKAIQRDPVRHHIEHVDLVAVKMGEKVVVEVPVQLDGKIAPGGLLEHVNDRIAVEAEATHLPEALVVDISGLEVGQSIHAGDITLPSGTLLVADADLVVVHVLAPQAAEPEPTTEAVVGTLEAAAEPAPADES